MQINNAKYGSYRLVPKVKTFGVLSYLVRIDIYAASGPKIYFRAESLDHKKLKSIHSSPKESKIKY